MLDFGHMTLEVLGEAALPMPIPEDPLVQTVASWPAVRPHRRLYELRLDRESGCGE
jgi:hypothetical protein